MSDIMKSIPFGQLMEWILAEHKETGQVFGIQKAYVADHGKNSRNIWKKTWRILADRQQARIHSWHRILWQLIMQGQDFLN